MAPVSRGALESNRGAMVIRVLVDETFAIKLSTQLSVAHAGHADLGF
jgi:hypothetical protein